MKEGDRSPWGKIQDAKELAQGVWFVSTASHGGIKLDRGRNGKIPALARTAAGWYEEDCDWAIPAYVFDDICKSFHHGADGKIAIRGTLQRWQSADVLKALGINA